MAFAISRLEELGFQVISGGKFKHKDGRETDIDLAPERLRGARGIGQKYAVAVTTGLVRYAVLLTDENREEIRKAFARAPFTRWKRINPPYDKGVLILASGKEVGEKEEVSPDAPTLPLEEIRRRIG